MFGAEMGYCSEKWIQLPPGPSGGFFEHANKLPGFERKSPRNSQTSEQMLSSQEGIYFILITKGRVKFRYG
jgi:hypothetical protein